MRLGTGLRGVRGGEPYPMNTSTGGAEAEVAAAPWRSRVRSGPVGPAGCSDSPQEATSSARLATNPPEAVGADAWVSLCVAAKDAVGAKSCRASRAVERIVSTNRTVVPRTMRLLSRCVDSASLTTLTRLSCLQG
uniref:Uncharacterized protein n=1 Tax=Streptomyces avermitilis TaxID=33903 RepID=A0A499VAS7_STRAX|nr:hypothetical protein SAVMC3_26090 [Streptomyces avermitilis]